MSTAPSQSLGLCAIDSAFRSMGHGGAVSVEDGFTTLSFGPDDANHDSSSTGGGVQSGDRLRCQAGMLRGAQVHYWLHNNTDSFPIQKWDANLFPRETERLAFTR